MNKAAQELGRLGGQAKSEAKAAASRENGKKGGRPRIYNKSAPTLSSNGLKGNSKDRRKQRRSKEK